MTGETRPPAWHVDPGTLRRWVEGTAGQLASASVEQHLLRCDPCRTDVAGMVPSEEVAAGQEALLAAVEVPRPSIVQRLLTRVGTGPSDALVIAAAVTMRAAWLAASIGVLLFAVVAALLAQTEGLALFLIAAPLIPVAGVAAAYGPGSDPAYEVVLSTPYAMIRLVLLRSLAVVVTSVPIVVVAGLCLPASAVVAVAWLLPAVGFVAVVLTASTWTEPSYAAAAVSLGWTVAVAWAARDGDPLAVFSLGAVLAYLVVLALAAGALTYRLVGTTPSWRLH